jgi:hypothetical protein
VEDPEALEALDPADTAPDLETTEAAADAAADVAAEAAAAAEAASAQRMWVTPPKQLPLRFLKRSTKARLLMRTGPTSLAIPAVIAAALTLAACDGSGGADQAGSVSPDEARALDDTEQ